MFKSFKHFSGLRIRDGLGLSSQRFITVKTHSESSNEIASFKQMLQDRHDQADRTILVKVNNPDECYELYNYVKKFGSVNIIYHYTTQDRLQFALVEMTDKKSYDIYKQATMTKNVVGTPSLNFFSFQPNVSCKSKPDKENLNDIILLKSPVRQLIDIMDLNLFKDEKLFNEKILILAEQSKINELSCRLRFLTAKQLENIVRVINPTIHVFPFGSSVNGLGINKSDLDLIAIPKLNLKECRLKFQMKTVNNINTIHMSTIQKLIANFLPGCHINENPILDENLNFTNQFTMLDCNFTLYNPKLLLWTELMYLISCADYRIKLLEYLIQQWGSKMSLTKNLLYDRCISSDTLTLLLLFFLQQKHFKYPPLIPSFNKINPDRLEFLSDIKYGHILNTLTDHAKNNELSVKELYFLFFRFYSKFDFEQYGMSIRTGQMVVKTNSLSDPLIVENPFFKDENVCKDVTSKNVKRLKECVRDTYEKLFAIYKEGIATESSDVKPDMIRN